MNDALYELLITRKPKATDLLIRIAVIAVIVGVAVFGMPFLGPMSLMAAIVLGILAWYLVFPMLSVEYEYVLLNHDLQIDAIYNQSKRKNKMSLDIQTAEIIAPNGSPRLHSFHPDKTYDFTSREENADVYAIIAPYEQATICLLIEPDQKMLDHMAQWMGSKMHRD